ncbi:hypothetical protein LBMAG18_07260 [Alphaproteobacteria bacterium]|nr:hypothetical protein LBMAG18_07260 [Alphaproteobacteria bacterium]
MKKILITRSKHNCKALSKFLIAQNYQVFSEPLFKVKKFCGQTNLENIENKFAINKSLVLIITSQNALACLSKIKFDKEILIFAVGKKTAQAINKLGYINVHYPLQSCANELFKLIVNYKFKNNPSLLYLRGEQITFNFKGILLKHGFKVEELIVYKTIKLQNFSQTFCDEVKKNNFEMVIVFSQKSLELFFLLAKKHNLLEYFVNSCLIGFSDKIVEQAKLLSKENLKFKKIEKLSDNRILKKFYE